MPMKLAYREGSRYPQKEEMGMEKKREKRKDSCSCETEVVRIVFFPLQQMLCLPLKFTNGEDM